MHELDVTSAVHAAMLVTLKLCTPLLLAPLAAGLAIAFLQAITQISDATVSFLPKLCATLAAAYYAGPYLGRTIADYMHMNFDKLVLIGGQ
jgi:flagellar biosynthetic protein FliQ